MTPWEPDPDALLRLCVIIAAAFVVYALLRRRFDFVIRVCADRVEFKGKFPIGQRPAVIHFLTSDAAVRGPCKIYGAWIKGRPAIWFSGHVSDGEKQRIRNFLMVGL